MIDFLYPEGVEKEKSSNNLLNFKNFLGGKKDKNEIKLSKEEEAE
jgi:hypothetical protein